MGRAMRWKKSNYRAGVVAWKLLEDLIECMENVWYSVRRIRHSEVPEKASLSSGKILEVLDFKIGFAGDEQPTFLG